MAVTAIAAVMAIVAVTAVHLSIHKFDCFPMGGWICRLDMIMGRDDQDVTLFRKSDISEDIDIGSCYINLAIVWFGPQV